MTGGAILGDKYPHRIITHNGTPCLHIIVEHQEGDAPNGMSHVYVPIADIEALLAEHGIKARTTEHLASAILSVSQAVVAEIEGIEASGETPTLGAAQALIQSMVTCFRAIIKYDHGKPIIAEEPHKTILKGSMADLTSYLTEYGFAVDDAWQPVEDEEGH